MKLTKEEKEAFKKAGRAGGKTTLKRHGKDHFKEISKKGVEAKAKKKNS